MLSKSKGQVLRVAASLHILFYLSDDEDAMTDVDSEISEAALKAAINFVTLCCQQTSFIAGRGEINDEIEILKASKYAVYQPGMLC
jgi:hypothetical protein